MVTLVLNVAEPLIADEVEKALFDAVGPLLLIGWSEVGPALLQALAAVPAAGRSAGFTPNRRLGQRFGGAGRRRGRRVAGAGTA
ncbi:hypothetical protein [Amycolatopsis thailandensis]|uniref:hypothetical protein n=1 Tax=Amycolatopsis thailandensis TaxID=589330 RepID=UPI0036372CDA